MAKRKIIILKLLPDESYCFNIEMGDKSTQYYAYMHGDWDPEDWKDAKSGDEFFLIQYKDNSTGIIMHGTLHSDAKPYGPYPGTKHGVYGTYLISDQHIDEDKYRLLSTETLKAAMPEFQWNAIYSGLTLPFQYENRIHQLWKKYLEMNDDLNTFELQSHPLISFNSCIFV